jgi:hypothetical protein
VIVLVPCCRLVTFPSVVTNAESLFELARCRPSAPVRSTFPPSARVPSTRTQLVWPKPFRLLLRTTSEIPVMLVGAMFATGNTSECARALPNTSVAVTET